MDASQLKRKLNSLNINTTLLGTFGALVIMCVLLMIISPYFRTFDNTINILLQSSINTVLAFAVLFPIIISGTDLSVGSMLALSGMVMAKVIKEQSMPVALGIGAALAVGVLLGALNGFMVTKLKLAPFIATLGMMSMARGITLVISEGKPISGMPESVRILGGKFRVFGILPVPVLITFIMLGITWIILKYTKFGRTLYSIGGNEEATRLSGINVIKSKMLVFMWCGLLSGLAGILLTARLNSAQAVAGQGYELDAIAAAVIGGASLAGGQGTALGALLGALVMGVLRNGLNLLKITPFWQQFVIGFVLVLAVSIDNFRKD